MRMSAKSGRFFGWWLFCLLVLISARAVTAQDDALSPEAQQNLASDVLTRLLQVSQSTKPQDAKYSTWPPRVTVEQSEDLNAYATAMPGCVPSIHLTSALMTRVLLNDADRTAFVLGHELSHVLLGHTTCSEQSAGSSFAANAYTRQMEFDADRNGVVLLLAAGYNERKALGALKTLDGIAGYSTFDALAVDHPATVDRLAALDKEQATLWHAMSAFDLGNSFLATEQYRLAATSFEAVTQQFDDAWDAWTNLGYARLMLYADGLRPDDVAAMQLGQVAAGGYFKTAESLRNKARGRDATVWKQAVNALKYAAAKQPRLALIQGDLGLAYTMAPVDADAAQAIPYLQKAIELDSAADQSAEQKLGAEINLAVAYRRMGDTANAQKTLEAMTRDAQKVHGGFAAVAYLFQRGVQQSQASSREELHDAEESLMQFMQTTGPDSPWRPMAYAAYQLACGKRNDTVKDAAVFATQATYRTVLSLDAADTVVYLGQSVDAVTAKLGHGERSPVVARSGLDRIHYAEAGLDVIVSSNTVAAIIEDDAKAKPVLIHSAALGSGENHSLKVGMTRGDWQKALAQQDSREDTLLDGETPYTLFPALGLALQLASDGSIQQIVIVQTATS